MYHWLALRLPFFKLEAQGVDIAQDACVIASSRKKVCAATPICLNEGVLIDMPASTAQALVACRVLDRHQGKEQQLLQTVCDALYAFTPYIQPHCPNEKNESSDLGVLLELSRCIRLFGGLEILVKKIFDAVTELNLHFEWGLAKSAKAAWLLSAPFQPDQKVVERSMTEVLQVKVAALDEYVDEVESLCGMGFITLADVKRHLDREGVFSLRKRFSEAFIQYLLDVLIIDSDDSLPAAHEQGDFFFNSSALLKKPTVIYHPEENYHDSIVFDYPITSLDLLHEPMQQLLKNLSDYLLAKQKQCAGIQWSFSDIYHNKEHLDVRCELIYRDWQLLYEISLIKLEQSGLPFEIDQLELIKPLLVDADFQTDELSIGQAAHTQSDRRALQRALAKVQARLGESNVFKVSYKDDHFPECAQRHIGVSELASQTLAGSHAYAIRPGWILNTPIGIGKNQNDLNWHGKVELVRGPERLEGHWWDKPTARDYFVAVREDQVRLWVFNDLFREEWFVQGVF